MIVNRILVQTVFLCHIALSGQGDVEAPKKPSAVWRAITPQPEQGEASDKEMITQSPEESESSDCDVSPSLLIDLPKDASSLIGQYLDGNKGDLRNWRRTSRHFNRQFDDPSRFQPLQVLFDQHQDLESQRYQSLNDLLQSVRCVPDVYVDVKDKEGIHSLARMHRLSDQEIFRGLTQEGKQPFLSFYFWEEFSGRISLEVLCVFDDSGSTIVECTVAKYGRFSKCYFPEPRCEYLVTESESQFDVTKLRDVLNSGSLDYDNNRWILCNSSTAERIRNIDCVCKGLLSGCFTVCVFGTAALIMYGLILLRRIECAQVHMNCSNMSF